MTLRDSLQLEYKHLSLIPKHITTQKVKLLSNRIIKILYICPGWSSRASAGREGGGQLLLTRILLPLVNALRTRRTNNNKPVLSEGNELASRVPEEYRLRIQSIRREKTTGERKVSPDRTH